MLAKIIVKGATAPRRCTQTAARARRHACSPASRPTWLTCARSSRDAVFVEGRQTTRYLNAFHYRPATIDVIEPARRPPCRTGPAASATGTSACRRPARWMRWPCASPTGWWAIRKAPPALEITWPARRCASTCDARHRPGRRRHAVPSWTASRSPNWRAHRGRGRQRAAVGAIAGRRLRAYLAVRGGFDVPDYLGSQAPPSPWASSVATPGARCGSATCCTWSGETSAPATERAACRGPASRATRTRWDIGVLYGPHGAPDFFTDADIEMFFATDWEVHYNSSRTGVRLIGPKPRMGAQGRRRGGLHPSNIHDNAYAIGAIDFTGDMPVILGPDGPSLGGFVCPATIVAGRAVEDGPAQARRHGALQAAVAGQATGRRTAAAMPSASEHCVELAAPRRSGVRDERSAGRARFCIASPRTENAVEVVYRRAGDNICWSNTARWCSISTCASACMR